MRSLSNCLFSILIFSYCFSTPLNAKRVEKQQHPSLASITIVDCDGITELISDPSRLKQYERVNFFSKQPYKKVIRVYQRDYQGTIRSYLTTYHTNGNVRQYLEIVNARAMGCYREWHSNGNVKLEAIVLSGHGDVGGVAEKSWIFDGLTRAWDEEGNLEASIPYKEGFLEGWAFYYHKNGAIWKKVPFLKGELNGEEAIYLDDGKLLQTCQYRDGVKSGCLKRFWPNGALAGEEIYQQGKLLTGQYRSLKGAIVSEVREGTGLRAIFGKNAVAELQEYKAGVQEGKVTVYSPDGVISGFYMMQKGLKHGQEMEYYPKKNKSNKSIPLLSVEWQYGKIQGTVRTWYPNGVLESQREISDNCKNGLSTAWYEDGNLMLIEEYEKDHLTLGKYFKKGDKLPISQIRDGKGLATLFDSLGNFLRKVTYNNGRPLP